VCFKRSYTESAYFAPIALTSAWVEGFLASRARGGDVRDTTLHVYADRLQVVQDAGVDLQNCSLEELNKFIDAVTDAAREDNTMDSST
jgi:hypothetical protein